MRPSFCIAAAAVLAALPAAGGAAPGASDPHGFEPCRLEGHPALPAAEARCTRLSVPLDPGAPEGERIELHVARVPAQSAAPLPDPLVLLAGGSGQAAGELYASLQGAFARIRRERDILLVDQRGTGASVPLRCPQLPEPEGVPPPAGDEKEDLGAAVADCLRTLPADPRWFTTSAAVRDLEAVRRELGYPQLNLYGVSYGTRVAQHYLRRYPQHTRAVILDGALPGDIALGPDIAPLAQRALDEAFARCAGSAACSEAFPELPARLDELLARLDAAPAQLTLPDPLAGTPGDARVTGNELRGVLRMLSYSPQGVALIPLLIAQAHAGHYGPLAAQAQMISGELAESLATGMHHSVVCTEDVPFYDVDAAGRAAIEESYLGTLVLDALLQVCAHWPQGFLDDDLRTPLTGDAPVLILSGEADPVTPPEYGERLAQRLPHARHIVGPGQGHGLAPHGCVPRLMAAFLQAPAEAQLPGDCVQALGPAPFFLDFAGPGP